MVNMTSNFQPRVRWLTPRESILTETEFKSGHPPFSPFPTVTNVINAALCPYASVHDLFYGINDARYGAEKLGVGTLFQEFIAYLKISLIDGECLPGQEWYFYDKFDWGDEVKDACRPYIEYWLRRKRGELSRLTEDTKIFFEVYVANDKIEVAGYNYPLTGRIDELDITNKKIIERTILGNENDTQPPPLKDFQVWLLWKILQSIPYEDLPEIVRDENFEEYELVVETPYNDFIIDKNDPRFENQAKDAYYWIYNLSRYSGRAIAEAWRNRRCTYENRSPICTLVDRSCYTARRQFPRGREILHSNIRHLYRALWNEQMWTHHLFMWQMMRLDPSKLSGWKILQGEIDEIQKEGDNLKLRLAFQNKEDPKVILEKREEREGETDVDIIFGSLKFGLLRKGTVRNVMETNKIEVAVKKDLPLSKKVNIILFPVTLFKENPWFLKRKIQREMHALELWGLDREDRARRHVIIGIIEALYTPHRRLQTTPQKNSHE